MLSAVLGLCVVTSLGWGAFVVDVGVLKVSMDGFAGGHSCVVLIVCQGVLGAP